MIKVFGVFSILFLQRICCLSGVILGTLSLFTFIPEILVLSFIISISLGFYILVLLSDELADKIDFGFLAGFTVSSVSVI